jgi:hypothetical protein
MRAELHAAITHLAQLGQAHHLKSAAVRQDGAGPSHEAVQAAHLAHCLHPGPQVEVIRVREQDVGARGAQLIGRQRFDRADGADRHECRGQHVAVRGGETSCAGRRRAILGFELERESHQGPGDTCADG